VLSCGWVLAIRVKRGFLMRDRGHDAVRVVRGWPCEVDGAPLRGRDGEGTPREPPKRWGRCRTCGGRTPPRIFGCLTRAGAGRFEPQGPHTPSAGERSSRGPGSDREIRLIVGRTAAEDQAARGTDSPALSRTKSTLLLSGAETATRPKGGKRGLGRNRTPAPSYR
jgi:hypothetical protein